MRQSWKVLFFFFFFFSPLHWSNILIAVVEAEMLRISDGIPDCGSPTIQTSCNYGSGDHGLAFGLSRSSWIVRGRSSTCTFDGVETVRCIEPPLLPSSHFHAFFFFLSPLHSLVFLSIHFECLELKFKKFFLYYFYFSNEFFDFVCCMDIGIFAWLYGCYTDIRLFVVVDWRLDIKRIANIVINIVDFRIFLI